ncbi:c-type cytochrome [Xanthobacter versatilis]|uniref:c-type cytochrome n=1 Tax=Xanthobacter autotrophicus (strain ATCC BAA-1158 / Py2) TaxID=78245 RepID=UPI003727BF91
MNDEGTVRRTPRLKTFAVAAAGVAVVGAAVFWWIVTPPRIDDGGRALPQAAAPELVARGKYIAELGDCVACHTKADGQPMAGGRGLETPFGMLYSTNITPDPQTGIGRYSFGAFDRAMRRGVTADGTHMYPAMPYPSYAKMTSDDMYALYVYLMKGVKPVDSPNRPSGIGFPFNQRWTLAFWNEMFLDNHPFVADARKGEVWNRGAYLVQGLGHCGACHTPRGIGFQELAMGDTGGSGDKFLSGSKVEEWNAVNLRGLGDVDDTVELLKTGQNRFGTVSGSMTEVIHNSTQNFADADLVAIATYLDGLPSGQARAPRPAKSGGVAAAVPEAMFTTRGGLAYAQFCADCHRLNGTGVAKVFPPLAGNPTVAAKDPSTLVHITLTGWATAETQAHSRVFTMPGFARLGDDEIADILSFVRASWGGNATPVTASEVKAARATLDPKVDTRAFDTPRIADVLGEPNAAQLVRGMRLNTETHTLLPKNVGNVLNCSSCHLNAGTVADGSPYVGVSAFFPSYAPRAGREITLEDRINGCFLRSMNGKPLAKDGDDMKAMVAYFDWMKRETKPEDKVEGRGVGKISQQIKPDTENGAKVYAAQCAVCHGSSGEGVKDAAGAFVYPPLWGDQSFNIGAGMARTYTAAAFVKRNMPIGFHGGFPLGQGGLTDQEAVDVAEYFSHMPRPDFAPKVNDWPKDKKPADARY